MMQEIRQNEEKPQIILAPTTTNLLDNAFGAVIVSGSHGGRYPGYSVAKAKVRAVILNDAGVGLDQAGIGSLLYLEALGISAATVSHLSCRIGDADDMMKRGRISHVNVIARLCGVSIGQPCAEAADLLTQSEHRVADPPQLGESRTEIGITGAKRRVILLDSAALVCPEDAGSIVVTGSHGGLVGGVAAMALRTEGYAAVFNDAGKGIDNAGLTRLPALDQRRVAAFTVAANSARIGEGHSSFYDGIISAVNSTAQEKGANIGDRASEVLHHWAINI